MKEHSVNKLDNFICGWYLDDDVLCDDLIYHHKHSKCYQGTGANNIIDLKEKDSMDCVLSDQALANRYFNSLQKCVDRYISKYSYCNHYSAWGINENVNIQHYKPNGGFHAWHTERGGAFLPVVNRHLVFMTYLNDVDDGGETEFFYQKIKVKPEKGLTLIWGSDWTFTHRGIPSATQEKYVITGWFSYNQVRM